MIIGIIIIAFLAFVVLLAGIATSIALFNHGDELEAIFCILLAIAGDSLVIWALVRVSCS